MISPADHLSMIAMLSDYLNISDAAPHTPNEFLEVPTPASSVNGVV